jgi:hypothetical protein
VWSVTCASRLLAVVGAAFVLAGSSAASPSPRYVYRYVAFVTVTGHGTVRSVPRGISCPKTCRALFVRGTHLRLVATPAPGWTFSGYDSTWCKGSTCAFDLVSSHDCVGGACPVGAFGVRVPFVRSPG